MGYLAVASGMHDVVAVLGVEKMTDTAGEETTTGLALAADQEYEAAEGVSFVGLNAMLMQRYMHQYGVKHEAFANFTVNAHRNALNNPNANDPWIGNISRALGYVHSSAFIGED